MDWIWLIQLAIDVGLIVGIMILFKPSKDLEAEDRERRIRELAEALERRVEELERELSKNRQAFEEQTQRLQHICRQARDLLDQGQVRITAFAPSQEEFELKGIRKEQTVDSAEHKIQTLKEMEDSQDQPRKDMELDLKTILRSQLA